MRKLRVGDRLPEDKFLITQDKINRYSRYALGRDTANIHTDANKARLAGLPGPVAHGRYPLAYISEAMLRAFGEAWLRGGELEVTMTKLIFPGDTLTLRAEVVSIRQEGNDDRITLSVALVNQHGEEVQLGEARVSLPASGSVAQRR